MDDPTQILGQVRDALILWGLAPTSIAVASQSENIVYKITTSEGTFAYRIHRPGYHTLDELIAENEWTKALSDAGFLLPATRPTQTGEYYLPVTVNGGSRYAEIIEWLEGCSLRELGESEPAIKPILAQLTPLGAMMAKLHNHSEQWQHSASFVRHKLDIDGFFGESPFWGRYWDSPGITKDQRALLLSTQENIIEKLEALGKSRDVYGMIHADLHDENVFVANNKMYLIDFDDAGFGWHLYDIAVALYTHAFGEDYQMLQAAFLKGYQQHRPLSDEHIKLIPMFLHIRTRALIGWLTARPELKEAARLKFLIDHACNEADQYS